MKKVGIATYCEWNSYGSILQSLALSEMLKTLDCEPYILKLQDFSSNGLKLYTKGKNLKSLLINGHNFLVKEKLQRKFAKTTTFMDEKFDFIFYENYDELLKKPPDADLFIAGSDQIWHPALKQPMFFLSFVKDHTKKFSYAASMGNLQIAEERKQEWLAQIKTFQTVSVREKGMVAVMQEALPQKMQVHIDPTFLMDAAYWHQLEKPYPIKKPYILVYALYWDCKKNAELRKLSLETGLPVVAIGGYSHKVFAHKYIYDAAPQEFLWLVDHAAYVVTSSFHGVAFSIIFNKKFSAVINPHLPSRIHDLLETVKISNCGITELTKELLFSYENVNQQIANERKCSWEYLHGVIYGQ